MLGLLAETATHSPDMVCVRCEAGVPGGAIGTTTSYSALSPSAPAEQQQQRENAKSKAAARKQWEEDAWMGGGEGRGEGRPTLTTIS